MKTRTLVHTLATLTCALLTLPAFAETDGTWTQTASGTHDWSNTANWDGGTVAGGTDATATFDVTPGGDQTAALDTAVTLGGLSLQWSNHALTIAGPNTLTLDVSSGTPILNLNSGRTLNMRTELAGSDGLQLEGGGTLNIFGDVSLTGGVTIIGSTLACGPSGSFNSSWIPIGEGPISLSEGALLRLRGNTTSTGPVTIGTGGGTLDIRGNNAFQTSGILTGAGTLTLTTPGGGGGRHYRFNSTDNDFTGGFVLTHSDQTLQVNSLADSTNNIRFNDNATFRYGSGAITALTLNDRAFRLHNSGTIDNANSTHAITINTDLIATGGGGKTLVLSGASGPTNVFAGNIADETDGGEGTVALTKSGNSTWVLSGNNTYSGTTRVSGGTLALRGDYSLPHVGTLNIAGGKVDIEGKARVAELQYAGGEFLEHGTYGSTDSSAENQNDDRFSGTGVLYVGVPLPPSGTMILFR